MNIKGSMDLYSFGYIAILRGFISIIAKCNRDIKSYINNANPKNQKQKYNNNRHPPPQNVHIVLKRR